MKLSLCCCLLILVSGSNTSAGILHEILNEKKPVTLRCPGSVERTVTWSRERNGVRTNIITIYNDVETKHIIDPYKYYSTLADKSLRIQKVQLSDSGRYFCNSEAAVDLTVIPSGIKILNTRRTSVSLTCPDVGGSDDPKWSTDAGEDQSDRDNEATTTTATMKRRTEAGPTTAVTMVTTPKRGWTTTELRQPNQTPRQRQNTPTTTTPTTTAPTTTAPTTTTSTTTTSTITTTTLFKTPVNDWKTTKKPKKKPRREKDQSRKKTTTTTLTTTPTPTGADIRHHTMLLYGIAAGFLLLFIIITIITIIACLKRRRSRKPVKEEEAPVYYEIQDGFLCQPKHDCSAQNDPTYSIISYLPLMGRMNDTGLQDESPYSCIQHIPSTGANNRNLTGPFISQNVFMSRNNLKHLMTSSSSCILRFPADD